MAGDWGPRSGDLIVRDLPGYCGAVREMYLSSSAQAEQRATYIIAGRSPEAATGCYRGITGRW